MCACRPSVFSRPDYSALAVEQRHASVPVSPPASAQLNQQALGYSHFVGVA